MISVFFRGELLLLRRSFLLCLGRFGVGVSWPVFVRQGGELFRFITIYIDE